VCVCVGSFLTQAEPSKEPIKTGWATKEGAVVKSWKKRFFVVRWDYKIEYYDKEEVCFPFQQHACVWSVGVASSSAPSLSPSPC
jgi:hypothetical protein